MHNPKENENKIKELMNNNYDINNLRQAIKYRIGVNGNDTEVIKFLKEEWNLLFNENKPV